MSPAQLSVFSLRRPCSELNLNYANNGRAASRVRLRSGIAQLYRSPPLISFRQQSSQWTGKHLYKFLDNQLSFLLVMDCNGE
jgi:hypothetical protein